MFQIQNITQDAKQKQTLVLPDGTFIQLSIRFIELQGGWFITELVYQDFILAGVRITNSPNVLHQYRNQIPFGLACFSDQQREPTLIQDFQSGASKMYILTQAECDEYTNYLSGG